MMLGFILRVFRSQSQGVEALMSESLDVADATTPSKARLCTQQGSDNELIRAGGFPLFYIEKNVSEADKTFRKSAKNK